VFQDGHGRLEKMWEKQIPPATRGERERERERERLSYVETLLVGMADVEQDAELEGTSLRWN